MKGNLKPLIAVLAITAGALTLSACRHDSRQTSAPVQNESETDSFEEEPPPQKESLTFELGNDIGRNVSKLSVRPGAESPWTEISLEGNLWKSGYIIPVKLEADSIPAAENGWEVEVTFSDDSSTMLFEGIPFENEKSFILTSDGVIFS